MGRTPEQIAVDMNVALSTVLDWKRQDDWDTRLAQQEQMLLSTVDGELKSWIRAAVSTAGITCINSLVMAASAIQRKLDAVEKADRLTVKELATLANTSIGIAESMMRLAEGLKGGGGPGTTKPKNLGPPKGTSPLPSPAKESPPPPQPAGGEEDEGGHHEEEGGEGFVFSHRQG